MIHIERFNNPNNKKINIILFAILIILVFCIVFFPKLDSLNPILPIITVIIFCVWLSRLFSLMPFSPTLIKEEKREFNRIYNQENVLPKFNTSQPSYIVLIYILICFILTRATNYLGFNFPTKSQGPLFYLIVGIFLSAYLYSLKRFFKKYPEYMAKVFEIVSTKLANTEIILESKSASSQDREEKIVKTSIKGIFKGHEFKFESYDNSNLSEIKKYTQTKIMGGIFFARSLPILFYTSVFKLNFTSKWNFSIREKNETWLNIEGNTIDEAFENRFEIKGVEPALISNQLKKLLLEYRRNLVLEVKENIITHKVATNKVLPYYGPEGMVLFLDFLFLLSQNLEESNSF